MHNIFTPRVIPYILRLNHTDFIIITVIDSKKKKKILPIPNAFNIVSSHLRITHWSLSIHSHSYASRFHCQLMDQVAIMPVSHYFNHMLCPQTIEPPKPQS